MIFFLNFQLIFFLKKGNVFWIFLWKRGLYRINQRVQVIRAATVVKWFSKTPAIIIFALNDFKTKFWTASMMFLRMSPGQGLILRHSGN
jgi:hypothetical protein